MVRINLNLASTISLLSEELGSPQSIKITKTKHSGHNTAITITFKLPIFALWDTT